MTVKPLNIFIGFDPREGLAFEIARQSIRRFDRFVPIQGLVLSRLKLDGVYWRPMEWRKSAADGPIMWDAISDAPMATEFALTRFLLPHLMDRNGLHGWALFTDCDVMMRANLQELRILLDDKKALMCVKHEHKPNNAVKMDGQPQTAYGRKNWSSVMAINCDHPANRALTVDVVNEKRGLWLHQLSWLDDDEIGALPPEWNYLVGHTQLPHLTKAKIVHWTSGGPWLPQYADVEYAEEWRHIVEQWATGFHTSVRVQSFVVPEGCVWHGNGAHP